MKLERVTPDDAEECVAWMTANLMENDCTPRTLHGSFFYKVAGVLYLPVKMVLLTESLAPNPKVTGAKRLLALRRAYNDLQQLYPGMEIQFLTKRDVPLYDAALRYGFEEAHGYVLLRLMEAAKGRENQKARKASASQARLRDNAGVLRADEATPAGHMRDMREAAGQWRPQGLPGSRPYQGDHDNPGHHPQPLQSGDRTCP